MYLVFAGLGNFSEIMVDCYGLVGKPLFLYHTQRVSIRLG